MTIEKLFRAYQSNRPITRVWRRTEQEAREDINIFSKGKGIIISKDINELVRNRHKTGFRGLL